MRERTDAEKDAIVEAARRLDAYMHQSPVQDGLVRETSERLHRLLNPSPLPTDRELVSLYESGGGDRNDELFTRALRFVFANALRRAANHPNLPDATKACRDFRAWADEMESR